MRTIAKWMPRLFLIALVVWGLSGILAYLLNRPVAPPSVKDAPWAIQTYSNDEMRIPSRIYFAQEMTIKADGTPVATTYWSFNGKSFKKHNGSIEFPVDTYGKIGITRRKG